MGAAMSYIADQLSQQEQQEAEREMTLWMAANAVREGLKRGDPVAIELMAELEEQGNAAWVISK